MVVSDVRDRCVGFPGLATARVYQCDLHDLALAVARPPFVSSLSRRKVISWDKMPVIFAI